MQWIVPVWTFFFACDDGRADQMMADIAREEREAAELCERLAEQVPKGALEPTVRTQAAVRHPLAVATADQALTSEHLNQLRIDIQCDTAAADALWAAFVEAAASATSAWSNASDVSTDLRTSLVTRGGLSPEASDALAARIKVLAASTKSATAPSELEGALHLCAVAEAQKLSGSACRTLSSRASRLEAAAQAEREREEAAQRRARAGRIDEALQCNTACLQSRPDDAPEESLQQCGRSCSARYSLSRRDWEDAFVDRCSPPPESTYGAAVCIVILSMRDSAAP